MNDQTKFVVGLIIVLLIILIIWWVLSAGSSDSDSDDDFEPKEKRRTRSSKKKNHIEPNYSDDEDDLENPRQINFTLKPYVRKNKAKTGLPIKLKNKYTTNASHMKGLNTDNAALIKPMFNIVLSNPAVIVKQGDGTTTTLTLLREGGYSGNPNLTIYNLTSGLTASFSNNPLVSSSVLTLSASLTTKLRSGSFYVMATDGLLAASVNVNFTVQASTPAQSFSLTGAPTTLSLTQGSTVSSVLTVNKQGGFAGNVTLSANELPSGVTASFATNPTNNTSILTLSANSTAVTGNSIVVVDGVSGTLSGSLSLNLTVNQSTTPNFFTLSASPPALIIPQSLYSSTSISVNGSSGFNSNVTLSVAGLPAGVSAVFTPSTTTTQSLLTLNVGSSVAAGIYALNVNGTADSTPILTSSTQVTLTVNPSNTNGGSITPGTSENWSGYVAAASLTSPTTNSCSSVEGTFVVPTLASTTDSTTNNVSLWVGIDGAFSTDPTVQQLGIDLEEINGQTIAYAWVELYPAASQQIVGFPITSGDSITAGIAIVSQIGNTTQYNMYLTNNTQNVSITIPANQSISSTAQNQSVEWIVEAPSLGNTIVPLSQFTPITWTNCNATINGTNSNISALQSLQLNMVSPGGQTRATTSGLSDTGDGFVVTWNSE